MRHDAYSFLMKDNMAFQLAVHESLKRDPRYAAQAYAFLCAALEHTVKIQQKEEEARHVTGQELLAGLRDLAVQEFGPMALFVLNEWGIHQSSDVGNMVYNFINIGYFGKNETDNIEDFSDGVDLQEALTRPFRTLKK